MLTKNDLSQIKTIVEEVVDTKLEEKLESKLEEKLTPVKKDLHSIKTRLRRVEKTVDVMAKVFDRQDVRLHKRVERIETHLHLPRLQTA